MRGEWLDSLARALVRPQAAAATTATRADEARLSRGSVVRRSALGMVALATVGPVETALGGRQAACPGGSRAACYAGIDRRFKQLLTSVCDATYKDSAADWGGKFSCYAGFTDARRKVRRECRQKCAPPTPPDSGGSGGTPPPGGGSGPKPTCGDVSCVGGDKCCPVRGGGLICCAVGCRKDGNGCCSSDSDCG